MHRRLAPPPAAATPVGMVSAMPAAGADREDPVAFAEDQKAGEPIGPVLRATLAEIPRPIVMGPDERAPGLDLLPQSSSRRVMRFQNRVRLLKKSG